MKNYFALLGIATLFLSFSCKTGKKEKEPENQSELISYQELVSKLYDLKQMAEMPEPGYKTALISSYDRESAYNEETGEYENWGSNGDGGTPDELKREGENIVLAELEGPGCVWRIWSALPNMGHIKMYFDGEETPRIDIPFTRFFNGKVKPFDLPELSYMAARGKNCYVPIPYEKSLKIVAEPGWGSFYQFTYSTFPKGTQVKSFEMDMNAEDYAALDKANKIFENMGEYPYEKTGEEVSISKSITIKAGGKAVLADIEGSYAIKAIKIETDFPDKEEEAKALRKMTIAIYWDGEEEPSVWSPLGDFFGSAPGINPYKSYPMGMGEKSMYSYWYMPFKERALIEVQNDDGADQTLKYEIVYDKPHMSADKLTRFHAKWHRGAFLPEDENRWMDWPLLKTEGKGKFAGVALYVWNPYGDWWGEGDEKFFVDNEKFPSTFGTGSEDYFGYAWCNAGYFQRAFHSQSKTEGNKGYQAVSRVHLSDDIPFQEAFDAYIEKYFPFDEDRDLSLTQYAAIAYWYLAPGGNDPYQPVPLGERFGWEIPRPEGELVELSDYKVDGAIEVEELKVLENSGEDRVILAASPFGIEKISGDKFVNWYMRFDADNILTFEFDWDKEGSYKLFVGSITWSNHGIIDFMVNGQEVGEDMDYYAPEEEGKVVEDEIGPVELKKGKNTFSLRFQGKNPELKKNRVQAVVDYIRFEKVD